MKFAMCQEAFKGWEWERICRTVKEAGYDGIELAPFMFAEDIRTVSGSLRTGIRDAAAAEGLEIVGLHWLLLSPPGLALSSPDPGIRRRTRDYLIALTDFCGEVGGRVMTLGSPKQRGIPEGHTYGEVRGWITDLLRVVCDHAHDQGVTLCLEALPAKDTDFMTTAAEARNVAEGIGSPGAAIMLDVKSMCAEGPQGSIPGIIRESAGAFRHFHANDSNLRAPGYGDVDFKPILGVLQDIGYDGYVSVEAFDFSPDPEVMAVESLRYMKACLTS